MLFAKIRIFSENVSYLCNMYSDRENVNILTAVLVGHGIRHVVVCPGSRNSPLVHNFNVCPDIECHQATDERSAGFIALGITIETGRPAAVCVTSGSALLNALPAAAEGTYQHRGIIVISADRPSAWIGQLEGQTMPQKGAMGDFVGLSVSLPEPDDDIRRWECNTLANKALMKVYSEPCPSVHINVPISEPLFSYTVDKLPDERIVYAVDWSLDYIKHSILTRMAEASRPMLVIGQTGECDIPDDYLAELSRKITVLTEPLSSTDMTWTPTDLMLASLGKRQEDYTPDVIIYIGGNTVSKRLRSFLRSSDAYQITVSSDGTLQDVSCRTQLVISGVPGDVVSYLNGMLSKEVPKEQKAFLKRWSGLRDKAEKRISDYQCGYSQMMAVKWLEETAEECDTFFYANSSPIRLASLYAHHHCRCNRGLNGIEGSLSTAVGAALAKAAGEDDSPVFCVIGDLSFFYDHNALWQNTLPPNLRILLLNNGGGGIFQGLGGVMESPAAELIAARQNFTAEGICSAFGIAYMKVEDENSLKQGIEMLRKKPMLLEVITDPAEDQRMIDNLYKYE